MNLVLATNNPNKIKEIDVLLSGLPVTIKTRDDFADFPDPDENEKTLEGNALIKAKEICSFTKMPSAADDTGLEVEALGGAPGVYSARYAGPDGNAERNIEKLLRELSQDADNNRDAMFRSVIALVYPDGREFLFEGIVNGIITKEKTGESGFGYDPVFIPEGFSKTFSEMTLEEKNQISHRGIALRKMKDWLLEELSK